MGKRSSGAQRAAWSEFLKSRGAALDQPPRAEPEPPARVKIRRGPSKLELELEGHLRLMGLHPEPQFRFHAERRWKFDFAFPRLQIAIDIDGDIFSAENGTVAGRHARGAGRIRDMEKRNAAAEMGYCVLTYGPPQIRSGEAAAQIERIVMARAAPPP